MLRTITFQGQTVYELTCGPSTVLVAPQNGARLLSWHIGGKSVIFWPEVADWTNIPGTRGGNPILFPFVARHMVNGEVGWWLDATGKKRALPMHGFARNLPFTVISESDPNILRMRLLPTPETQTYYPFQFAFDVVYRLSDTELEVRLEASNTGSEPMPYYMGHHFYFTVPHTDRANWETNIPCERRGRQNPDGSITENPSSGPITPLSEPTLSDSFHIELKAKTISLLERGTGRGVVIDLDKGGNAPWYDVTTWTEKADSNFYCVEPWTGLPNAIHHGKGLRYLPAGSKESAVCTIKAKV